MIGDVLTSSILFEALRKKYPKAVLHYLIQPHTSAVVENNPFIDQLIIFDPEKTSSFFKLLQFSAGIKQEHYDVVIDVYSKINSAIITAFSGAEKKIGYSKWYTSRAYTKTFDLKKEPDTKAGVAVENRLLLLQEISPDFPIALKPKIFLTEKEKASAKTTLENAGVIPGKPLLMIGILGSSPEKSYPIPYMATVLNFIVDQTGAQLLFNYNPKQEEQARELFSLCSTKTRNHINFDVFGKSLRDFLALTSKCDALIGNEGGAVNMAKAINIPTFSIFSPQISKSAWSLFEDEQNRAVHISDYKNFAGDKKRSEKYLNFTPDLFLPELHDFIKKILPGT